MIRFLCSAGILLAGVILTLIPAEFWFLVWWLVGPVGFWQKALIAGAGIWICGMVQVIFLIVGVIFTCIFLSDYRDWSAPPK